VECVEKRSRKLNRYPSFDPRFRKDKKGKWVVDSIFVGQKLVKKENRNRRYSKMKDFLKGTLGTLLQVVFLIAGFGFMAASFGSCTEGHTGWGAFYLFVGIILWCGIAGIRYALGHIFRLR